MKKNNNGLVFLLGALAAPLAHAQTFSIPVTITVTMPTCDIQFSQDSGFDANNSYDFGQVEPTAITQDPTGTLSHTFHLDLSACTGLAAVTGYLPKITMMGQTITDGSNNGTHLFNDNAEDSARHVGYIVKLGDNSVTWNNSDANGFAYTLAQEGASIPASLPVTVGISKGDNQSVIGGNLNAAITFTFGYQ